MIYVTSFEIYILYSRINFARDFLLIILLTEINIIQSSTLTLFEIKFTMLINDQNAHDQENDNNYH